MGPCCTSAGECIRQRKLFATLRMSENDRGKHCTGFGLTYQFQWVGEFTNTKLMNNEDWLNFVAKNDEHIKLELDNLETIF